MKLALFGEPELVVQVGVIAVGQHLAANRPVLLALPTFVGPDQVSLILDPYVYLTAA